MKNNRLPSKKEWDEIVDDAFSSSEIHEFSVRYERRKAELQKGNIMDNNERRREKESSRRKINPSALIAMAAAVALVPASVFAVSHLGSNKAPLTEVELSSVEETTAGEVTEAETEPVSEEAAEETEASGYFYAKIEKTAEYQNYIYVNYPANGDRINETLTTEFGWLPEGVTLGGENTNVAGKYHNGYGGGMTPCLMIVPERGIQERLDNSADFEQYETDDRVIMINYRVSYEENAPHDEDYVQDKPAHINFGREVWVAFKGTKYVQMFYITDDFSKDDVRQIAENIRLVPAEEETVGEWADWDAESENTGDGTVDVYTPPTIEKDNANLVKVGDTINIGFEQFGEDIRINSARYQDNFDGLHTDASGWETDFSEYLDSSGRIINHREWMKSGDGVNTVDTLVSFENQLMKVLVLDVTYTNTGSADINYDTMGSVICPTILTNDNGSMKKPSTIAWDSEEGMYANDSLLHLMCDDMMFSFDSPNKGNNNHVNIPVGGSADIQLAFLVSEDMIGNVYINITGDDFTDPETPILDLCDLK